MDDHMPMVNDCHVQSAGRLKYYVDEWRKLTSDSNILDMVQHAHLHFSEGFIPMQHKNVQPYSMSQTERSVVDGELAKLIQKGVIQEWNETSDQYLSNVFLRPKKDGSYRLILNLKELNQQIEYKKFKMETLDSIIKLMRPGCFMCSLDLSDAYYSVPVAPEHQKFLCFPWVNQGVRKIYAYTCFPNGLTSAPRDFTKLLKPPLAHLRLLGVTIAIYIDDTYIQGTTAQECKDHMEMTKDMLQRLGFAINENKSVYEPTQKLTMLGFILDSVSMTIRPTKEKSEKIVALCQTKLEEQRCTIRDLARLIGNIVATFPGVQFGPLHYREMEVKNQRTQMVQGQF